MIDGVPVLVVRFRGDAPPALQRHGVALYRALEGDDGHAYVADPVLATWLESGAARRADVTWSRLELLREFDGASRDAPAPFRYVVATDVVAAHEDEFNAWYDGEHLPGLASVPGTVRAGRYRTTSGGPRYHACYDLVAPQTLGSAPWLVVRGTPWSDRVRPHFRNTYRRMFRQVEGRMA